MRIFREASWIKQTVFTGVVAGALMLSACVPAPVGPSPTPGPGPGPSPVPTPTPTQPPLTSGKIQQKFMTQVEFDKEDESGQKQRTCTVEAVDPRGATIDGTVASPEFGEQDGSCEVWLWPNALNKVTVKMTGTGDPDMIRYVRTGSSDSSTSQAQSAALWITPTVHETSKYIEELFNDNAYNVWGAARAAIDALYDLALACGDLSDAHDDDLLAEQGRNALLDCLIDDSEPLLGLARDKGGRCHAPLLNVNEFQESGTYTDGTDLGDTAAHGTSESADASDCLMTTVNGSAVTHTVTVFGDAMVAAGDEATACHASNFDDDRIDCVFGEKTTAGGNADQTAFWGYCQLAKGLDAGEPTHSFIPGGIFFFGGEAASTNDDDIELSSGDFVSVDLGTTLAAYNLIAISNPPEEIDDSGFAPDEDTRWAVFSETDGIDDADTDGRADGETLRDAIEDVSNEVVLVQECNPSEEIEFTTLADGTDTVVLELNDSLTIAEEDEDEKRLFAGFLLVVDIDDADPDTFANIAQAVFEGVQRNDPVSDFLVNRKDVLDDGDINMAPAELAIMAARTHALCDWAVVGLGGGDDIVINNGPAYPNCAASGLRPGEEVIVDCLLDQSELRADDHGVVSFASCRAEDGTVPSQVTVTSGSVESKIDVEKK